MKKLLLLLLVSLLLISTVQARYDYFEFPDIKSDFCGSKMGVYYCKCAFHGEYCSNAGMDKSTASKHVYSKFNEYVSEQMKAFGLSCMLAGGIYTSSRPQCEYCEGKKVRSKGVCKDPDDVRPIEEVYNLPKHVPVVESEEAPQTGINGWGEIIASEGEFFVYSAGLGKWIGPVNGQRRLYPGDMVITKQGRGEISFGGASRLRISERTQLIVPTPTKKRSVLERGVIAIWENIKRLGRNEAFEVEGGHSIAGIKGTEFILQVDNDGTATYTVKEGIVEVSSMDNPSDKRDLNDGESAKVTNTGVENNTYEWDTLVKENGWKDWKYTEVEYSGPEEQIDPDAINPPEAA